MNSYERKENGIGINSSKVYCKCYNTSTTKDSSSVLIVAKCIVNVSEFQFLLQRLFVLIVAKCIVNYNESKFCRPVRWVLIVAKCIVNPWFYAGIQGN